jgi:hypothetical protein
MGSLIDELQRREAAARAEAEELRGPHLNGTRPKVTAPKGWGQRAEGCRGGAG